MLEELNESIGRWLEKDSSLKIEDLQLLIPLKVGEKSGVLNFPFITTEYGKLELKFSSFIEDTQMLLFDKRTSHIIPPSKVKEVGMHRKEALSHFQRLSSLSTFRSFF
ncbi:hypothetical protein AAXE64_27425 [Priestia megaterium]